jgi:MOSC domain-containing protein YiiM
METVAVKDVFVGKAEKFGLGLSSAINKQRLTQRLWLWPQGLGQDEQGDPRFHGGAERALHHYPAEHYAYWRQRFPQRDWQAPAFGENLSTLGLNESQVCIGDIFRWGEALLQVSQPRSPCYRLSHQHGLAELPLAAQENGRCGWFYRVLKPGFVGPEDSLERVQRSYPGLTVAMALSSFYQFPLERAGLQRLVACEALGARWREIAAQRLASGVVEDWNPRLQGTAPAGLSAIRESVLLAHNCQMRPWQRQAHA